MEDYRSFIAEDCVDWDFPIGDEPCMDLPPMIGADERRMHIRAYEMWLSLLDGRDYPAIGDLDAEALGEFGPHSVLLDFSVDALNPGITYLGRALREEGEIDPDVETVADVPEQALLARLTEHYAEILANRAPVGFEADYINRRGQPILYRGILMPYSSDGSRIDMIHGVVNWKEAAGANLPADIVQAVTTAFAGPAQPLVEVDQDSAEDPALAAFTDLDQPPLAELVQDAQDLAQEAVACEGRTRNALYRALSLAYDVALAAEAEPAAFEAMLAEAGIVPQARAPMTPVVKLVFGRDYDRKRVTEFAAVLTHAHRLCLAPSSLQGWLSGIEGGIKAVVAAERGERRPALKVDRALSARMLLGSAPARAVVDLGEVEAEVVLLVARREADGRLAIVAKPIAEKALVDKALQRFAS